MRIAIGADHAGFVLKERLAGALRERGHEVADQGTFSNASVDYPDYAAAVAQRVASGLADRGVLVCSTGVGMSIAANKIAGVRAAVATSPEVVHLTRSHNDANVIAFGANFIDEPTALALLEIFLNTPFEGGRHARRVDKIAALESSLELKTT